MVGVPQTRQLRVGRAFQRALVGQLGVSCRVHVSWHCHSGLAGMCILQYVTTTIEQSRTEKLLNGQHLVPTEPTLKRHQAAIIPS